MKVNRAVWDLPSLCYTILFTLLLVRGETHLLPAVSAAGSEMAHFTIPQMTPGVSYRQDICHRYDAFRNGTVELKDSLRGMKMNVLMSAYEDGYFNYDPETGINPDNPGLTAILMDELARRARFTWRDSFGTSIAPYGNHSWTDLLVWGVDVYDMNIDWWAQNVERMNAGVAFLEEWYDSSIILIRKRPVEVVSDEINFWNWLRPYDFQVWALTIFTVILSGIVYQWLEHLAGERGDRTMWEWWLENWYLSALNFTQAYEYHPNTLETRLFGVSMAIWALVMTATYTANLASLLVDRTTPHVVVASIEEAVIAAIPICTFEGTNSDTFIKLNMPSAVRVEKKTLEEVYQGLQDGECSLAAEVVASWEELKSIRKYNPYCDLERVSATVWPNKAGFATKADAGELCSGLIRDVINLHMAEMISDGFLEDAWEREHKISLDIDCDAYRPDLTYGDGGGAGDDADGESPNGLLEGGEGGRWRRLLTETSSSLSNYNSNNYHPGFKEIRRLKAAGKGASGGAVAAASAENEGDAEKLKIEQMIGTFVFHWFVMAVGLAIGHFKLYYGMYGKKKVKTLKKSVSSTFSKWTNTTRGVQSSTTVEPNNNINNLASRNPSSNVLQLLDGSGDNHHHDLSLEYGTAATDGIDKECCGCPGNSFAENNIDDDDDGGNERTTNVHQQLKVLRDSHLLMHRNQKEMLEEQRMLKEQIQLLVSLVNQEHMGIENP